MEKINIKYYGYEIIAGLINGLIVFGGNYFADQGLSLYQICIFSAIPSILFNGTLVLFNKKYRFKKENLGALVLYGLITCLINLAQFGAVILGTPVAVVVFLLYTQPLWTIIFERILFKEKLTKIRIIACIIVIVGILFLIDPWNVTNLGNIYGLIVSLLGGITLSGWVVQGGYLTEKHNSSVNTSFSGSLFSVLFLSISLPIMMHFTSDISIINMSFDVPIKLIGIIILYGVITQAISPLFYLEGVKKVPVVDAGIILLLEPVCGAFLAYFILGQSLTWSILIGALFILVANYFVIKYDK